MGLKTSEVSETSEVLYGRSLMNLLKKRNKLNKIKLNAGAVIILIFTLFFNAALGLSSLKKHYEEAVISQYREMGKDLQRHLEAGSGLNLEPAVEMSRIPEEAKERIIREIAPKDTVSVSVATADGIIRYSTERNLNGRLLPEQTCKKADSKNLSVKSDYIKDEDTYMLFIPVRNREKELSGTVVIGFGENQIRSLNDRMFHKNFKTLAIIITCGAFLLIILNLMILKTDHLQKVPKKKLSVAIFSVILLSQIIFSGLNIYDFKSGVRSQESEVRSNEMILDSLTVLVISVFFFVEMLIMLFYFIEKEFSQPLKICYGVIRPATFLFFFSFSLSISFLPLHIEKLYKPILGLSKDMVMGLPISFRTFLVGIFFLVAGLWLDRRGWHEPFFTGLFLSVAGFFYCWLAPDALHFIIACGVIGSGYGLYLMASQGFIISYTDEKSKAQGFAQLFSGVYAGMLCGSAAGAILAEIVGYNYIFFISALIFFLVIIYTSLFMREAIRKPENNPDEPSNKDINIRQIFLFLFDRNIITLFLFSSLFVNMTMTGFIEYFNPVYLNRIGVSQSNIGRTFMLYSFCIVYMGPFISKYIDISGNKKMYIFINGIVGSAGFILFYLLDALFASFTAVMMLGISQSFIFVSQNTYMLKFKVTRELGGGKAIAVFRSASRIGQVAGPIVFGWLIISIGTDRGIAFFGFAYLTASFLFFLLASKENN